MRLELVPLLRRQRDLYDIPPGRERFDRYLEVMLDSGEDLELPLQLFNPMAKPRAAEVLDRFLELDAETVAREAIGDAAARLEPWVDRDERLRVGLVLVDDAGGGWTHRELTELRAHLDPGAELSRGWTTVLLWTGALPSAEGVRRETLAAVFRGLWVRRYGGARNLGEVLVQEGLAAAFSGRRSRVDAARLTATRAVIDPERGSSHFSTIFSCLYGDAAAAAVGYEAGRGLGPRAGLELALAEALASDRSPEETLAVGAGAGAGVAGAGAPGRSVVVERRGDA